MGQLSKMIWAAFRTQLSEAFDLLHVESYAELAGILAGAMVAYVLVTAIVCLAWGAAQ